MSGSGGEQNTWAKDSSAFIVQGGGGEWVPFSLTGKIPTPNGSHALPLNGPAFSYNDPLIIFGRSSDDRSLCSYNLQTQAITNIVSFPSLAIGEVSPSLNDRIACYGKGGQDTATEVYVWDGSKLRTLDTLTGKANGIAQAMPLANPITWGFGIHNVRLDKSGRFAIITPATLNGISAGPPLVIWDIDNNTVYGPGVAANGHKASGVGYLVNQDVAPDGSDWDDMQFTIRKLDGSDTPKNLVRPVVRPARTMSSGSLGQDCHLSWNNHQTNEPVLVSAYREAKNTDVWRAFDNEIILVTSDGSGTVYRVCHHRSAYDHFWDGPHGVISPDGTKAVFTSNMNRSLGTGEDGESRRDVFRVDLMSASTPPPPVDPVPVPGPVVGAIKKDVPWTISETADNKTARQLRLEGWYFKEHQTGKKATFVYTGVKLA
jgi:hypothetical protein